MVPTVTVKWKTVGEVLLDPTIVENKELDTIKENYPQNATECCKQMFVKWLDTDRDASWKRLIAALQCTGVELNCLAERIKRLLKGRLPISNLLIVHLFNIKLIMNYACMVLGVFDKHTPNSEVTKIKVQKVEGLSVASFQRPRNRGVCILIHVVYIRVEIRLKD